MSIAIRSFSAFVGAVANLLSAPKPVRIHPLPTLPRDLVPQAVMVIPNVFHHAPHQRFNPVILATVARHTPLSGRHQPRAARHARVRDLF